MARVRFIFQSILRLITVYVVASVMCWCGCVLAAPAKDHPFVRSRFPASACCPLFHHLVKSLEQTALQGRGGVSLSHLLSFQSQNLSQHWIDEQLLQRLDPLLIWCFKGDQPPIQPIADQISRALGAMVAKWIFTELKLDAKWIFAELNMVL